MSFKYGVRAFVALSFSVASLLVLPAAASADASDFAAVQYGTNGCIEVGARPDAPYNQPRPFIAPADYDLLSGYPAAGYDTGEYTQTSGTNSCRYNFRDHDGNVIGSAYCVQWAAGQQTGTGYDPEPSDGTIRNIGFVRRILAEYWPATNAPAVPSTNATVINRQRSGTVAMAIHYFTDGVVMPSDYQAPGLYDVVKGVVDEVLAKGPLDEPGDPTPTIEGPDGGTTGEFIGPFTIGANATGPVTVTVEGAEAFTDAAGTEPFAGGDLAPGDRLWIRADAAGDVTIKAVGPVVADIGTMMVPDPSVKVQRMMLAAPLTLEGKAAHPVEITPPPPTPALSTQVAAALIETGAETVDDVTVTGLADASAATVTSTLYGPVSPSGGCDGVDWASAPVLRAFAPVAITGGGTHRTPAVVLDEPGCYSFGTVLEPAGGTAVELPPGSANEIVRVVRKVVPPPFSITTAASDNEILSGDTVTDEITVSGLLPGQGMTITPVLFGPIAPDAKKGCAGADWSAGPPVHKLFDPVAITGNTTFTTPKVTLTAPGCYGFAATVTNKLVTGGEVPVHHSLGAAAEVVRVLGRPVLPVTGTSDPRTAALGVAALILGAALFGLGRRRRD